MKRASSTVVACLPVILTFVLCTSGVPSVHAQPPASAGSVASPASKSRSYSALLSFSLSLLGTGVGYGLVGLAAYTEDEALTWIAVGGLMLGPSVGHLYTGDTWRALVPAGLRGLGSVMAVQGGFMALGDYADQETGIALFFGGLALYAGSTLYSIVDAPLSARRANRRQQRLQIMPAPVVGPDRSVGMGLTLGGSF